MRNDSKTQGSESSGPHASAHQNATTFQFMMASYRFPETLEECTQYPHRSRHKIQVQDFKKEKSEWKCAVFCFPLNRDAESTYVISFHQPSTTFVNSLRGILESLEAKKVLVKK